MKKAKAPLSLAALRQRIDSIDSEILRLISDRADAALHIAALKKQNPEATCFYRPEREAQLLRAVRSQNPGPLDDAAVSYLFREIMSACLALESPLRVGFPSSEEGVARQAVLKHFGHASVAVPVDTIRDVFRQVADKTLHYGVVPVEKAPEGIVCATLDAWLEYPLFVCGTATLPVRYQLLCSQAASPAALTRIFGSPRTLFLCRSWLDAFCPGAERLAVAHHREAIECAGAEPDTAAIVDEGAGQESSLVCMASGVGADDKSLNRFFVVGRAQIPPSGEDQTVVHVSLPNPPGSLYALLAPFHEHHIDPLRVTAVPVSPAARQCRFVIDCPGHFQDPAFDAVSRVLAGQGVDCTVLGSCPVEVS